MPTRPSASVATPIEPMTAPPPRPAGRTAAALARALGPGFPHVVVTGAHCLVGRHLAHHLADAGWRVTVVDVPSSGVRSGTSTTVGSTQQPVLWHELAAPLEIDDRIDVVVNLAMLRAASAVSDPAILRTASEATQHTLDLARRHDAVYVLASSSDVYGRGGHDRRAEDELGRTDFQGGAAARQQAHRFAEALVACAARSHGAKVRVGRLFNVYGAVADPPSDVISTFVSQAVHGQPLTIHGDGSQTRTFVHVEDVTEALARLMRSDLDLPGAVNIGGASPISMIALARMIRRLTGSSSTVRRCAEPEGTVRHRHPDIARANSHLGWRPRIALAEGLQRTVEDFRLRTAEARTLPLIDPQRETTAAARQPQASTSGR